MARKMCLSIPVGVILAGCGAVPGLTGPRDFDIPSEMSSVIQHADRYRIADDHPLWDVAPGDVLDPDATLAGCWGAYTKVKIDDKEGDPAGDYYEVFAFDPAHQRMRWTNYSKNPIVEKYQGAIGEKIITLAVYEGDIATSAPTEVSSNLRVTTYETQPAILSLGAESFFAGEQLTWVHQFTIDGDYMVQSYMAAECNPDCHATGASSLQVYRRVDCSYASPD